MIVEEIYEFNIGDAVVVKSWKEMKEEFPDGVPCGFNSKMEYMCGAVLHIKSMTPLYGSTCAKFRSEEDLESLHCSIPRGFWNLSTAMVRPVSECSQLEDVPEDDFLDILNA